MKKNSFKRSMAFMAAAMMVCQPISAYAATFADLNQVPWKGAEASINKAAELGLVVGETKNGKTYFRPRDSVSLAESCQLAYKLLSQTNKASADASVQEKWSTVMGVYGIQKWAYPAISFCLEEGIISISNLSSFMKNGSNLPATREQAATILGRALSVGVPSQAPTETTTKFGDNSSISTEARPYVALLNQAGVLKGDEKGNFNPKKTLNRTETAVLVTNLYTVLDKSTESPSNPVTPPTQTTSTQKGTVADVNARYINFKDSNAYYFYADGSVSFTLNGKSSTVDELVKLFKAGTTLNATVTLNGDYRATKVEVTYEAKDEEKDTKGKLTKVKYDEDDNDGSITIDSKHTFTIEDGDDVDIEIDKKDYDLEELYDLFTDCEKDDKTIEVEVTLNKDDEVTKIKGSVEDDEDSGDVKGEVSTVSYDEDDDDENYIKLKNKSTKYYVEDIDDVTVKIDNKSKDYEDLYDLYEDDNYLYVELTLDKDDYITRIDASTEEDEDEDEIKNEEIEKVTYDDDEGEGTIKIDGDTYDASDVDDVDIKITDGDNDDIKTWEDLFNAYEDDKTMIVTVSVKGDEVTEIEGYVSEAKGLLVDFSNTSLTIEGKESEDEFDYEFDDDEMEDIDVDIDGINADDMDEFMDWLDDFDEDEDKIDITLKLDKNGLITEVTGTYDD